MNFDHEKLDVYRVALEFAAWAFEVSSGLDGLSRHARDQLLRASQSIPLNIAEGNGKRSPKDRRRFFEIARGSATECAAILDILVFQNVLSDEDAIRAKELLIRIVSMLTRLTETGDRVKEEEIDYDHDGER